MKKLKKKIKVAIDSPAAAGAGTLAKAISKYFMTKWLVTSVSTNNLHAIDMYCNNSIE